MKRQALSFVLMVVLATSGTFVATAANAASAQYAVKAATSSGGLESWFMTFETNKIAWDLGASNTWYEVDAGIWRESHGWYFEALLGAIGNTSTGHMTSWSPQLYGFLLGPTHIQVDVLGTVSVRSADEASWSGNLLATRKIASTPLQFGGKVECDWARRSAPSIIAGPALDLVTRKDIWVSAAILPPVTNQTNGEVKLSVLKLF